MGEKLQLDGKEYELDDTNESVKAKLASIQFVTEKIQELNNMQALLNRAKNSYIESLKNEMISKKAGFQLEDN